MHENFVAKLESIFAAVRPVKLLFMALGTQKSSVREFFAVFSQIPPLLASFEC